jgi:adenylate cyclase
MIAAIRNWFRLHNKLIEQATPIAVALVATLVASWAVGSIALLEHADQFVGDFEASFFAAPEPMDSQVMVVAITEDTLAQFPYRSPVDRAFVSQLLAKIASLHPRAIGLDLLLDQATEPAKDDLLRKTLRTLPVPLVVSYSDDPNIEKPYQQAILDTFVPPDLRGYATLGEDSLDVVRWIFPGKIDKGGRYIPSLARALAMKAGANTPSQQIPIVWHGQPASDTPAFQEIPAQFAGVLPSSIFAGKIVLVGTDITLVDRHRTPFDVIDPQGLGDMAGVVIQAHAVSQLLRGRQSPAVGWLMNLLVVFVCAAMGARLGAVNLALLARVGAGLGFVVVLWGFGAALYYFGGALIGLLAPSIAMATSLWATDSLTGRDARQQREFIHGAFSRYVSPKVVEQLVNDPGKISLEGQRREMTFLFSDIAGFTTMSEALESHELARILNEYLDGMTGCVLKYDGMVDKFIGDAVFAIFNAPVDLPNHAECAVKCALEMDRFAHAFHREQQARGIGFGITRIGVHTGPAVIGNFGSSTRFNYTAQGDSVNVASRLEALNKHFHTRLAVSGATKAACPGMAFRPIARVVLMGKTEPIEVWEPLHDDDPRAGFMARYGTAYARLRCEDPLAREMFAELAGEAPDDPCVALHLSRLAEGGQGDTIVMTEK